MRRQYLVIFIFIAFAILIFVFRNLPPVRFVTSFIENIFSVPKAAIYGVKSSLSETDSEVSKLKQESDELSKKFIDYRRIIRDNEALRSQFESSETKSLKLLPVSIIGFLGRFNDPKDLVINAGSKDGIKRGMAVVTGINLIGKIDEISENYSKVTLLSNEKFSEVAKTSENAAIGIVSGQSDFILLSQVSIKDKLSNREIVLTRGGGESEKSMVPAGLVIGKISSIYKNESMPYQTAKVDSAISLQKLETVFVVMGFL
jgi:rod shape-determining protein MreC